MHSSHSLLPLTQRTNVAGALVLLSSSDQFVRQARRDVRNVGWYKQDTKHLGPWAFRSPTPDLYFSFVLPLISSVFVSLLTCFPFIHTCTSACGAESKSCTFWRKTVSVLLATPPRESESNSETRALECHSAHPIIGPHDSLRHWDCFHCVRLDLEKKTVSCPNDEYWEEQDAVHINRHRFRFYSVLKCFEY